MRTRKIYPAIILLTFSLSGFSTEQRAGLGANAALRYWSAFAQMQDAAMPDEQAKALTAVLEGTTPYADAKYRSLVERNRPALEAMLRGTTLPECDWGLDYQLGANTPVEYVRKALALGRLNVLYGFHLLLAGEKDHAVRTLAGGLRFSSDVATGGTLFSALAAKGLIIQHLGAIESALRAPQLSAGQRTDLLKAVSRLGDGPDWQSAIRRELDLLRGINAQAPPIMAKITPAYLEILNKPAELPMLQKLISDAPAPLPGVIPNPRRVIDEKLALSDRLAKMRSQLR